MASYNNVNLFKSNVCLKYSSLQKTRHWTYLHDREKQKSSSKWTFIIIPSDKIQTRNNHNQKNQSDEVSCSPKVRIFFAEQGFRAMNILYCFLQTKCFDAGLVDGLWA